MKIGKLFLIGVIALGLGLTACNSDDVPNTVKEGEKATVSIKITKTTAGTRMATDTYANVSERTVAESAIKKLDVFVFNGDAVDGHGTASGTNVLEVKDIAVTTGSRTLVVVANATADMGTITSKAALLAKVATDLSAQTLENGLLMTSEETAAFTIAAGKNYYGYSAGQTPAGTEHSVAAPVKLTRVPARVALVGATTAFEGSYEKWTFTPEQVFLFNAKKQSKYFGTSLVAGTELLSGVDLTPFDGALKPATWDAGWTAAYLQDAVANLSTISTDKPVYYYTFENDATVQPTVLSIKGKIKKADGSPATATEFPGAIDAAGYTYYSIVVNATRGGYTYTGETVAHDGTIIRNTQYNISVTIKHLGKDDPTDPPTETAMLDVLVEVVPWVVVNQAVEY
ncbi:fimbrial protein [Petrimonas sp.]|uniref:fimbrial protein n=1 Tax=Petrimonas sp. TaxID=2023866 RepID=UPI003F5173C1